MAHWFFNTPGIGAIIVFTVFISVFLAYFSMVRWVQAAPPDPESQDDTSISDVDK